MRHPLTISSVQGLDRGVLRSPTSLTFSLGEKDVEGKRREA